MKRCMGCMAEIEDLFEICPICGYKKNTPPREAYHMQPETILYGRYIVGRVLGYGGFGVTYIGYDAQLERKIAIKEFLPSTFATRMPGFTQVTVYGGEATEQFKAGLDRFVEEARKLAGFNGIPGIVDIYDTFVENNTAYIVMEYLQGVDVKGLLEANGPMPYNEAKDIILKICDTLQPVHEQQVIHRDISPDNIFLTESGDVKLIDFGASRYATSVNSKSLSVILKSGYAPEEQYRSRGEQGSWSDVYALAATFYKMITGITPEDSMERAIKDELPEPSKRGAQLPKAAENAIMNALNIKKENRTQTVKDFKQSLLAGEVERIKVKHKKSDSGHLSLTGKIVIGILIGIMGAFALLSASGVIGGKSYLQDTFGSAVPDGYVNTPGVINLSEKKAQKATQKANLEYLIVGKEYSDDIEKGRVLTQEPLPGRVIEKGNTLEVTISGGNRSDAVENGDVTLPDVSYMKIAEAVYQMESNGFYYYIDYEYSDTVAEGLVSRMEAFESGTGAHLYVSMGKESGDFELRAPFIENANEGFFLNVAIASNKSYEDMTEQEQEERNRIQYKLYYSLDQGKTWNIFKDVNGDLNINDTDTYDEHGNFLANAIHLNIANLVTTCSPELVGKEFLLKLEQYRDKQKSGSATEEPSENGNYLWNSITFEDQITVTISQDAPNVDKVEEISWDELDKGIASGEISEYVEMKDYDDDGRNHTKIFKLTGDFKEGDSYAVMNDLPINWMDGSIVTCFKRGEIYITESNWDDVPKEIFYKYLTVVAKGKLDKSASWKVEAGHPNIFLMKDGEAICNIKGLQEQEATSKIEKFLGKSLDSINKGYMASDTIEAGNIVMFSYYQDGENTSITYFVSLGMSNQTSQSDSNNLYGTMQFPELKMNGSVPVLYAVVNGIKDDNPDDTIGFTVSYSTDGGKNWISYKNADGSAEEAYEYNYQIPSTEEQNSPQTYELWLSDDFFQSQSLFIGKTVQFRLERNIGKMSEEGYVNEALDQSVLPQTITISQEGNVQVTNHQEISLNEIGDAIKEGKVDSDSELSTFYENQIEYGEANYKYYRLSGNFKKGSKYYLLEEHTSSTRGFQCYQDGELFYWDYHSDEPNTEEQKNYKENGSIQRIDCIQDNNGNFLVNISESLPYNLNF